MFSPTTTLTNDELSASTAGRPYFKRNGDIVSVSNVAELGQVADEVFNTLAVPGVHITPDLLKQAFNEHTRSLIETSRTTSIKPSLLAAKWVEAVIPGQSQIRSFLHSSLGVSIVRDLVNLPLLPARRVLTESYVCKRTIAQLDKSFIDSELCCLNVRHVRAVAADKSGGRFKAKFVFDSGIEHNGAYLYGQLYSGYCGVTGNLCMDDAEAMQRREDIEATWKSRKTAQMPQWFEAYAGCRDPNKAAVSFALQDLQPSVSAVATLAAQKKNLILLAFLCSHNEHLNVEEMAHNIVGALYEEDSGFPLRCANGFYLKVKEGLTLPAHFNLGMTCGADQLKELGVEPRKAAVMCGIPGKKLANIPFTNALSDVQLSDAERTDLEPGSVMLVPVTLGSYKANRVYFTAGILRNFNYHTPVLVGKAGLLFAPRTIQQDPDRPNFFLPIDGEERDLYCLAEEIKKIVGGGAISNTTFDEACAILSVRGELKCMLQKLLV